MKTLLLLFVMLFSISTFSQNCQADFSTTVNGNVATFTDLSNLPFGAALATWDFGDLTPPYTIISGFIPTSHTYTVGGTYNTCLTIVSVDSVIFNCTSTYCDSVVIPPVPQNCQAYFTSTSVGTTASFQNLSLVLGPGVVTSTWAIGTMPPITIVGGPGSVYTFTFPSTGTYNVCLTINSFDSLVGSCTSTYCDSIVITSIPTCQASFYYNQDPINPNGFHFINTSTVPVGTNYVWIFEQNFGQPDTNFNTYHVFPIGSWEACFYMWTADSTCEDSHCDTITINTPPPCDASFITIQDSINPNLYYFLYTPASADDQWVWIFSNIDTSWFLPQSIPNPQYILPPVLGLQYVSLTVWTDSTACVSTDSLEYSPTGSIHEIDSGKLIKIYPNPTVDFIYFNKTVNEVLLFDILGQMVFSDRNIQKIDMTPYRKGVYYAKIGDQTIKIIRQ